MSRPEPTPSTTNNIVPEETPPKRGWRKFLERSGNWLQYKDKNEWLKDMRGNLSLMATVIATMTFQSAINPPGGVAQANGNEKIECLRNDTKIACPGEAVLAVRYKDGYVAFLACNTICFIASLSVCLLLVSGLPLNHRLPTWLLSICMCITITSLALTYLFGTIMVTPDAIFDSVTSIFGIVLLVWIALFGVVGILLIIRFVVWCVTQCMKRSNALPTPERNEKISVNHA